MPPTPQAKNLALFVPVMFVVAAIGAVAMWVWG